MDLFLFVLFIYFFVIFVWQKKKGGPLTDIVSEKHNQDVVRKENNPPLASVQSSFK